MPEVEATLYATKTDAERKSVLAPFVALATIGGALAALLHCYAPGLAGPFLLDDFFNIEKIGIIHDRVTWDRLIAYLNTGISGPTGRPISLLTFLVDGTNWPTSPEPFKRTNVYVHAINGLLIFWLSLLFLRKMKGDAATGGAIIAGLAAMVWTFSPYHASTVLYVVQRMTMLSATFSLIALITYFKGRGLITLRPGIGFSLIILAYAVGAGLGVLAKENAALFVLMVPLVEWVWFSGRETLDEKPKRILYSLIALPAILLIAGVFAQLPSFFETYANSRDFTMLERLLTQFRTVGYYLWRYLIPGTEYVGIYADGIQKSTGLFSPFSTALWVLIHAALVAMAIWMRSRDRIISFAILFFYVGHLMESTIVPLELLFEHRSYLPSAFLFLALSSLISKRNFIIVAALALALNAAYLQQQARNWSGSLVFSRTQFEENPSSERALIALARHYVNVGNSPYALSTLRDFAERNGVGQTAAFMLMVLACTQNDVRPDDVDHFVAYPYKEREKPGAFGIKLGEVINLARNRSCEGLDYSVIHRLLDAYLVAFPRGEHELYAYHVASAKLALAEGDTNAFRRHGMDAIRLYPGTGFIADFCSTLGRIRPEDECSCMEYGEEQLESGSSDRRTLVRMITGYRSALREGFDIRKARACGPD